jgi:hypothetical protein
MPIQSANTSRNPSTTANTTTAMNKVVSDLLRRCVFTIHGIDYSGPYSADLNNITAGKFNCSGNTLVQGSNLSATQVNGQCAPFKQ